ncbi:MAG TPA: hypothetical protein DHV56_17280 [Rhodobacter sp.]|nr:hypothetical protein [Rhodobacter sp.]
MQGWVKQPIAGQFGMDGITAADRIRHDMITHFRRHGWEAFRQRVMQSKRFAVCLQGEFSKEPFQEGVAFSRIGPTSTGRRDDIFDLQRESSGRRQAVSGPKLRKEQTVGGCHPTLSARKVQCRFDCNDKGLTTCFTVFAGDASSIKSCSQKV